MTTLIDEQIEREPWQHLEHDRVRQHTRATVNTQVDERLRRELLAIADSPDAINARLNELEYEWDIDQAIETHAAVAALTGTALGVFKDKRWFAVPGLISVFLFQHATQGWYPPLFLLRKLGMRTRQEIDAEKYALKALRGDFDPIHGKDATPRRAEAAMHAV